MALETSPPHTGDIGEPDDGFCEDPMHDHDCTCGAQPDAWEEF